MPFKWNATRVQVLPNQRPQQQQHISSTTQVQKGATNASSYGLGQPPRDAQNAPLAGRQQANGSGGAGLSSVQGASSSFQHGSGRPAAPITQGTHELAYRLGNSVSVLQEFIMSVARPPAQNQYANMLSFPNGDSSGTKVPNSVWEALAEVEAVRNALLQQPQSPNQQAP